MRSLLGVDVIMIFMEAFYFFKHLFLRNLDLGVRMSWARKEVHDYVFMGFRYMLETKISSNFMSLIVVAS